MDGMAQIHTELPFLANQKKFDNQLPQHLLGIKEHGQKFVLYRSYANVSNDRDLAIYCLLSQIENRFERCNYTLPTLFTYKSMAVRKMQTRHCWQFVST